MRTGHRGQRGRIGAIGTSASTCGLIRHPGAVVLSGCGRIGAQCTFGIPWESGTTRWGVSVYAWRLGSLCVLVRSQRVRCGPRQSGARLSLGAQRGLAWTPALWASMGCVSRCAGLPYCSVLVGPLFGSSPLFGFECLGRASLRLLRARTQVVSDPMRGLATRAAPSRLAAARSVSRVVARSFARSSVRAPTRRWPLF